MDGQEVAPLPALAGALRGAPAQEVLGELLELRVQRRSLPVDPLADPRQLGHPVARRHRDVVVGERIGPQHAEGERGGDRDPGEAAQRVQPRRAEHGGEHDGRGDDHQRLAVGPRRAAVDDEHAGQHRDAHVQQHRPRAGSQADQPDQAEDDRDRRDHEEDAREHPVATDRVQAVVAGDPDPERLQLAQRPEQVAELALRSDDPARGLRVLRELEQRLQGAGDRDGREHADLAEQRAPAGPGEPRGDQRSEQQRAEPERGREPHDAERSGRRHRERDRAPSAAVTPSGVRRDERRHRRHRECRPDLLHAALQYVGHDDRRLGGEERHDGTDAAILDDRRDQRPEREREPGRQQRQEALESPGDVEVDDRRQRAGRRRAAAGVPADAVVLDEAELVRRGRQ